MVNTSGNQTKFSEWQLPNLSSFLPNLLFAPALWLVFAPINQFVGTASGLGLTVASIVIRIAVSKRIELNGEALSIGTAMIPTKVLASAEVIAAEHQFAERGSRLDARAYLALKGGLPGLVKIKLNDPDDPTPYLLISTRKAEELANAING